MARIGLYFGSFNPIHTGHLMIAQHMLNEGPFDEIWFVVSPQNPFKEQKDLLPQNLRLDMVKAAVADNPQFRAMDIEFRLPLPSYTIQTVEHLLEKSNNHFSIIMGEDNLERLHEWKDINRLITLIDFHVYRRAETVKQHITLKADIKVYNTPLIDISATYIRQLLTKKCNTRYLVPDAARLLLIKNGFETA
jgi:nicotinate-nucleotide adenylyltransferase